MKKIAFFVEGQTERIFVEKFLYEYLGGHNIELRSEKNWGRRGVEVIGERKNPNAIYYILIFDVGGDGGVSSAIKEKAEAMIADSGYNYLLALRDLYPRPRTDKKAVIEAFYRIFDGYLFSHQIKLILAIMEIEAWFLSDYNLFSTIESSATYSFIKQKLNINLAIENPESYDHPSKVINNIFNLSGKEYKKREADSYKIAYKIDYEFLCCSREVLDKVKSWNYFLDSVNKCFS